jgi:hypothetical protein
MKHTIVLVHGAPTELLVRPGRHLAWWTCHQIGLQPAPSGCAASMTYAPQMPEGAASSESLSAGRSGGTLAA